MPYVEGSNFVAKNVQNTIGGASGTVKRVLKNKQTDICRHCLQVHLFLSHSSCCSQELQSEACVYNSVCLLQS